MKPAQTVSNQHPNPHSPQLPKLPFSLSMDFEAISSCRDCLASLPAEHKRLCFKQQSNGY